MKRFFIIASMAILAIGCQKTEIQNEVQTPIGFSTEVGKQTRAIAQGTTYDVNQPFGVYAYGHQTGVDANNDGTITTGEEKVTTVMDNVEISLRTADSKWAASGTVKYYWPNDPRTTLNFYAYSPAYATNNHQGDALPAHQTLHFGTTEGDGISHGETDGLKLTNYVHSNMYVDFMVANPVEGATYSVPSGIVATAEDDDTEYGNVPVVFNHEMTQINFTVKLNAKVTTNTTEGGATTTTIENTYPNINFEIQSIVLKNIVSQASYAYKATGLKWTPAKNNGSNITSSYQIYPATKNEAESGAAYPYSYEAPALENVDATTENVEKTVVLRTDKDRTGLNVTGKANPGITFNTTPVTMVPQAFVSGDSQQAFVVTYKISGTGVAEEVVSKEFKFADANVNWEANKKITYTLTIGLNEITFEPTVSPWSDKGGDYYNPDNIKS